MFYFRISVSPTTYSEEHQEYFESTAHVFVEAENIEKAAVDVVKKMKAERWRIVDVITARHLLPDERFSHDDFMLQAVREAEANGHAFFVESSAARSGAPAYPSSEDILRDETASADPADVTG